MTRSPDPAKVFDRKSITVKDQSDKYSDVRYEAKHAKTGKPVFDPIYGRNCQTRSERSNAQAGVLFKHLANRSGLVNLPLGEHERAMLDEMAVNGEWCGRINGDWHDKIHGDYALKALIDDSTSGGLELVPITFDEDVITFPLLNGELFPHVDLRPVPRGRRVEGASISTPTMSWGGGDNSSISLFSTSSIASAIDTTIFTIDGAVEIGRDFLADSPVNVGDVLTGVVGQRLLEELDGVIASGNGTTQPEGLDAASGLSSVTWGSSTTIGNYESLLFGLGKQYRKAPSCAFVANDTSYQRARAIPVGASDARRIFGMSHEDYMLLSRPYYVNNDIANTVVIFGDMKKYRMYRRQGLEVRFVDGGKELARRNMLLMVYRARFGGQVMDSSAFVKTTDAPS